MTTIIDAAITVLKTANKALSADEIYVAICKGNLFQFGAKDPKAILKAQLQTFSASLPGRLEGLKAAEMSKIIENTVNYTIVHNFYDIKTTKQ